MIIELTDYLEANENLPSTGLHGELVGDIIAHLHLMDIEIPYNTYTEVKLSESGKPIGSVDLVIKTQSELYVVEARVIDAISLDDRQKRTEIRNLNRQLVRDHDFLGEIFLQQPKR